MTTEMQEIAITEDKPLLTGQADSTKVRDDDTHTHTYKTMHTRILWYSESDMSTL